MNAEQERRYVEYVQLRQPWLRRVAYLLCQDWHRADDLVQIAITQLYTHWRRASGADNIDGYVRTILVRTFLGERRSAWARRVELRAELPDLPSVTADSVERLAVRAAMTAVPPRQRATLVLRYYVDLPVEEIAEVLQCSVGTVKSQTARGLESLRRAMDAMDAHQPAAGRKEPMAGERARWERAR